MSTRTLPETTPVPQFTMMERFREYAGVGGFFLGLIALAMTFAIDRATDNALNSLSKQTVDHLAKLQPAPATGQQATEVELVVSYSPFNSFGFIGDFFNGVNFTVVVLVLAFLAYLYYDKKIKPKRQAAVINDDSDDDSTTP